METDRRRRQTPSVHPGSRKPLISVEGAGLDRGRKRWREGWRGRKCTMAGEEGCNTQAVNTHTELILARFNFPLRIAVSHENLLIHSR